MPFLLIFFLALVSPNVVIGSTYDCGPHYATMKVLRCSAGMCDVLYQNPGQPPRRTPMYESSIQTAIERQYVASTGRTC